MNRPPARGTWRWTKCSSNGESECRPLPADLRLERADALAGLFPVLLGSSSNIRPVKTARRCRRLTGGGAILHDNEITYSIVLPGGHRLAGRRDELYQAMHGCLIEALAGFGAACAVCEGGATAKSAAEPFLCFQRRSPGDVLLGEHKICGSAQRRRNGAVLQHGSLLWRASPRHRNCQAWPIWPTSEFRWTSS